MYDFAWRLAPRSVTRTSAPPGSWLIIADGLGYAEALAKALQTSGARTLLARDAKEFRRIDASHCEVDLHNRAHLEQLLSAVPGADRWTGVVHCGAIGGGFGASMTAAQLEAMQSNGFASLLSLTQAIVAAPASAGAKLVVVTRGAHSVSTEPLAAHGIAGASAWGLARVIASEHPATRCLRIDLDSRGNPQSQSAALAADILGAEDGEEIALRAGQQRFVARLNSHTAASRVTEAPSGPVRLEASRAGILDELRWVPHTRRAPGTREVEIEVRSTGLGFRDVLNSLGMYPGGPVPLGCECAGVVVAAGADVGHVRVGDAVLAVAYGSFATHVTVPGEWAVRKPSVLSFEQAAAIPSSFLTAVYALLTVAKLARATARAHPRRSGWRWAGRHPGGTPRWSGSVRHGRQRGEARLSHLARCASRIRLAYDGLRGRDPEDHRRSRRRCRAQLAGR